jgi:hypothetical protein
MLWRNYQTDTGRIYPFYAVSLRQINDISTDFDPLDLLPVADIENLIDANRVLPCTVPELTPRQIHLFDTDGGEFLLNYWQPFERILFDFYITNTNVAAFEFIGERIKYGRLRRMLENV